MIDAHTLRAALRSSPKLPAPDLHGRQQAAVLVPLYLHRGTLHAVLTLRNDTLRHHPGQISFPGGRREAGDRDLIHTALREAHEEIGLDPDTVDVVGSLEPAPTIVSDFAVHPFVGLLPPAQHFIADPREVDAVIELPLHALAATYAKRTLTRSGQTFITDSYDAGEHLVWGATARILADLLARIDPVTGARRAL